MENYKIIIKGENLEFEAEISGLISGQIIAFIANVKKMNE